MKNAFTICNFLYSYFHFIIDLIALNYSWKLHLHISIECLGFEARTERSGHIDLCAYGNRAIRRDSVKSLHH